jgi:hypothetical protein
MYMRISSRVKPPRRAVAWPAIGLAGAILLGAGPPAPWTTTAAVDLGAAAHFAVLAGGGITDTGPSVISGDVGTYPRPAIADLLDKEATGSVDRAGAKSQQAQQALANALATIAALPLDGTASLADDRTLPPGVYDVADATPGPAAGLILDGHDAPNPVWVFLVAKDLTTAPGSTITLVNGAQACNVFWRVGGSAVLASGSTFAGSILAMTSVTVGSGVTIAGRLLARTAAVSLAGDSITAPVCTLSTAKSAAQPVAVRALAPSSRSPGAAARSPSALPAFLPILMLVLLAAAVVLGEPHHRHRPVVRGGR